jgi:hypothetical protein
LDVRQTVGLRTLKHGDKASMKATKTKKKRGRPKAAYEIGRATYSLPAKLIDLVEGYAAQESTSNSEAVSAALIEFFAGKRVKPKRKRPNIVDIARKKGLNL